MASKTRSTTKTPARANFDAVLQLVNIERVAAKLAEKNGESAEKVHNQLKGLTHRLNKDNGIVAERSREVVVDFINTVKELEAGDTLVLGLLERFEKSVVYRTAKTGPRDSSWIRDLRAGKPRLEKDGKYYAYTEITKEAAEKICKDLGCELPVDDEDSLDVAAEETDEAEA